MNPTLSVLRAAAGRAGGLRRSASQAEALARLHAARRGRRVQTPGISQRALAVLLSEVEGAIRLRPERGRISIRAAASACGVSDRTLRRWLDGTDWPDRRSVRRLQAWLRSIDLAS